MTQAGLPDVRPAPLRVFVVAGEHSGDLLGGGLLRALATAREGLTFSGVGGSAMEAAGLRSIFPMTDIAVMGIVPVIRKLPTLLRRIRETADAAIAFAPDVLIIIDSPDFTHRVAARVRASLPQLPIIDYVSPSVWAWRPGRARKMRAYVDHVLALLPFEPAAHERLGGPDCTYVGHPLIERLSELRPGEAEQARRDARPPLVLALPGSRRSEIERLMDDFGAALALTTQKVGPIEIVLPAVAHLAPEIERRAAGWPVRPKIVFGEAAKYEAFRNARAALAASGTVTLELGLAGVPMAVAYKYSRIEGLAKPFVNVPSIVLPNLALGRNAIPEFLQDDCTPQTLSNALVGLIEDGPEREAQTGALASLDTCMMLPNGETPSDRAAEVVLRYADKGRV